ncbi:prepilin peptidase [Vibrio sp. B1Z05]|uniref:prepilin peptidase n=1 Tax=Vibrio sp. B1Z05 TaxID=2654980 RepID=UPI001562243E|nr:A24 family peptidase [Vibrio sp. B1Z05]
MNSYIVFWSLLFLISINDLKFHRIPNKLLLILLSFQALNIHIYELPLGNFLLGGTLLFFISLIMFLLKVMSPGDVKLLGVVGFCVGLNDVGGCITWIVLASGIIGTLFTVYNFSFLGIKNPLLLINEPKLYTRINTNAQNSNPWRYGDKLTMPFAPSVMVGLALFYYFN